MSGPNAIPDKFRERYRQIIDDEGAFYSSLDSYLPRCFRVNTLKAEKREVLERFKSYGIKSRPIPWNDNAFVVDDISANRTLEHFLGHIYIQEAISMLPAMLIPREALGPQSRILDACAAPGSKTTQVAAAMDNQGLIVANDANFSRLKALKFNIEKQGVVNTIVTNYDFRFFPKAESFDCVLLDAPCSAEGTLRKNYNVFDNWSERLIINLSRLQKAMIMKAFELLRPGGTLIYSTCTFAPEENEEVVQHLLDSASGAELAEIKTRGLKTVPGLHEWNGRKFDREISRCARVYPHHNDTGGFFAAKVVKQ